MNPVGPIRLYRSAVNLIIRSDGRDRSPRDGHAVFVGNNAFQVAPLTATKQQHEDEQSGDRSRQIASVNLEQNEQVSHDHPLDSVREA
jgi:hypothetical protein